jgi:FG-GAP repeat.
LNVLSVFTEGQDISLSGVSNGSAACGDYDNDGDLDILLTGSGMAKIYRNTAGNFSEDGAIALPAVSDASVAFGDYDNDGDLDILIAGNAVSGKIAKIYRNAGGSFSEDTSIELPGVYQGSVSFADTDNDGDLDILIAGDSDSGKIDKNIQKHRWQLQ